MVLWGALAARAGLALDRRGTQRIAAFTITEPRDGTMPLAGGWCLDVERDAYILGRRTQSPPSVTASLPTSGSLEWGGFRFRVCDESESASPWAATFGQQSEVRVRSWMAGDRLQSSGHTPARRVTRYLSDVGLQGEERAHWPVVVQGDDVLWIPGVRRSDAATDRSGRPVRHYVCERIVGG